MTGVRRPPRVLVSAGEVSGDIVAARVIERIRSANPAVVVSGAGGARMGAAGAEIVARTEQVGAVGVSEILGVVPAAVSALRAIRAHVRDVRPEVALLVGNDIFNAMLGRWLRRQGVTTISLFPPQIWLWRPIAPILRSSFDEVLASFPDEADGYREAGIPTRFVGHYLSNVLRPPTGSERERARRALGCGGRAPVVALLPGSRRHEIDRLLTWMLDAVERMRSRTPDLQLLLPAIATHAAMVERALAGRPHLGVRMTGDSHLTLRAADLAICCSGTVTLEAALLGVPAVVLYRLSRLSHLVVRTAVAAGALPRAPIALPNLILGGQVVPEFTEWRCTPAMVADAALRLLEDPGAHASMVRAFAEVRRRVHADDTIDRVATFVIARTGAAPGATPVRLAAAPSPGRCE